jgi:outer membrane lipoprotein-sorting protein
MALMTSCLIVTFLVLPNLLYASQSHDITAADILRHIRSTWSEVEDYSVRLQAEIDMEKVRVPPMDIMVYYKQPDKIHLQSKGFAILPRDGIFINPNRFSTEAFYMSLLGKETLKNVETYKIELVPRKQEIKIRKLTMWVDPERWIFLKVHTISLRGLSAHVDFEYALFQDKYWLPVRAIAIINFTGFKGFAPYHKMFGREKESDSEAGDKTGRITIQFSDYKINVGLSDSIFEQPKDVLPEVE